MTTGSATVDTQGMVLIHRVVRREIGALPALVRDAAGRPARAKRVAAHASEMLDFLHVHHQGEDQLVWPLLRERVSFDDALIDRMEEQHRSVSAAIAAVRRDLRSWAGLADAATGDRIAETIESMLTVLLPHLTEEEERVLPEVARTFSQSEWDALADHGFSAIPNKRRLVMLGHILEEANADERAHMLTKVPPPARVAFNVVGRRQFERETAALRTSP
jgi:hemerythrin-like domain-containing protein